MSKDSQVFPKIVSARIGPMPKSLLDAMPEVLVDFDDGRKDIKLFSFYPDEISFKPSELIGLTEEQARALFHRKDVEFLRS